jgi:hypothetical protein
MASPVKQSGPGCLVLSLAFVVVIVLGLVVGTMLNPGDDEEGERAVTLADGTLDGTTWRVDATRDEQGDSCVFLFADGEQLTGACSLTPQDATFGDETVVFGKAASEDGTVSVLLDTGEVVDITTQTVDGLDGRFYLEVVAGDVDAEGFAP